MGLAAEKPYTKNNKDDVKLEIKYSPLSSGGCRRMGCLSFAALGPARGRSISK